MEPEAPPAFERSRLTVRGRLQPMPRAARLASLEDVQAAPRGSDDKATAPSSWVCRTTHPDPGAATVLLDELDAGLLKGGADGSEGSGPRISFTSLKPDQRALSYAAALGKLIAGPI